MSSIRDRFSGRYSGGGCGNTVDITQLHLTKMYCNKLFKSLLFSIVVLIITKNDDVLAQLVWSPIQVDPDSEYNFIFIYKNLIFCDYFTHKIYV